MNRLGLVVVAGLLTALAASFAWRLVDGDSLGPTEYLLGALLVAALASGALRFARRAV